MNIETIDLHFADASSNKVYHACLAPATDGSGHLVTFAYGRRGAALTTGSKTPSPVPFEKAQSIYRKLVAEKTGKGYVPAPGISGNVFGIDADTTTATAAPTTTITIPPKTLTGILPQLLIAIDEAEAMALIHDDDYVAQEKKNGKRVIYEKADSIKATNRKGIEIPPVHEIATGLSAADKGQYDGEGIGQVLHVFDLLSYAGACLRHLPYIDRYDILARTLTESAAVKIVPLARTTAEKLALWNRVKAEKGEGVVFKRAKATFTVGKAHNDHFKHKFWRMTSLIVAGINPGKRSIVMSMPDADGNVIGVGNCTIPVNHQMPKVGSIVEIRYLYAYAGGSLYQPQYEGVRDDIDAPDTIDTLTYYVEEMAEAA